ncbi:hypothetical protein CCR90_08635 [Rhodovulum sulfidophilum]|uniref:Uncharacterized protein n=3 Tax=Rhodovulum TaxID=34008 RepID=A0ABS1RZN5_RHOSU|nr:hypothetical protein [Rhodovulum sulfidophilum]ANB34704.1 hypothetical protein A6W98_11910 [Rhodovulum sulfidophilum DSM 1374]ANB38526.1 hypothetical protein A6024_11775 [Rhodovulum sulfidophilum]MBK5923844.1 hypothetical protein [Rhodovulum sulfidophilum]MBL3611398.1 hypothetical protein [Rhodovulum sulfidophilum]MCE8438343.1 hypothetical protein [Rhodovulum sulfidophilum]
MGLMEMLALILCIQVSFGLIFLGALIWGMRHMAETRRRLEAEAADFDRQFDRAYTRIRRTQLQ